MNNTYNSNMYLTTNNLNDIENNIETLTNQIQYYIFDNETSSLINLEVGDSLNSRTLYLSFPRNSYENVTSSTETKILTTDNNNSIAYISANDKKSIYIIYKNKSYIIYNKNNSDFNPNVNKVKMKLPYDFGIISNIDNTDIFYQYIKMYENDMIIPNYEKHVWENNEILTMQKINNIENGIKNIGRYFYKPIGWLNVREWLKDSDIFDDNTNTNIQNISYQDLNRWTNNLSLINFNNVFDKTFWNTNITGIEWNGRTNAEWEEY